MLTSRRPAAVAVLGTAVVGLMLGASGCVVASPATITTPYAAADGTNAQLDTSGGPVKFRNFVLVTAEKGKPGVLVGAVSTDGTKPVEVQFQIVGSDSSPLGRGRVDLEPGKLALLGTGSDAAATVQISSVPVPPGSTLTLQAAAATGEGTSFTLPVVAADRYYSSITPTASASSSSSSSSPTSSSRSATATTSSSS